jgi:hypothetical protein
VFLENVIVFFNRLRARQRIEEFTAHFVCPRELQVLVAGKQDAFFCPINGILECLAGEGAFVFGGLTQNSS